MLGMLILVLIAVFAAIIAVRTLTFHPKAQPEISQEEYQFDKIARGFTKGRNDTVYTDDDMVIKPIEEKLPEGTDDLFDTDDDEI